MKKLLILILIPLLGVSCTAGIDPNNIWGVKANKDIFFSITINGKTITSYGVKFTVSTYESWAFDYLYGNTRTFTNYNQEVVTESDIYVNPIYNSVWSWSQFGLKDGDVEAQFSLTKNGTIIGVHKIETYGFRKIIDKTNGNVEYIIEPTSSTVNITEIDGKSIKGTFNFNLTLGTQLIPATGSFRLWRLD